LKHIRVKGKTEKKAPKDAVDEMMNKRPDHAVQVYPPPSRPDPSEDPLRRNLQWRVDYSVDYGDKGFNRIGYFKTKWGAQRSILIIRPRRSESSSPSNASLISDAESP
jgi:hypothetical protein